MPWARASALDRHLECPATSWFFRADRGEWRPGYLAKFDLPPPTVPCPPDDSVLAQWGTEMHLAKEGHPEAADPWVSWMEPHRDKLWPLGLGKHEVAWAFNCRTGLVELCPLGADKDAWKAGQDHDCVVGTTDWDALLPSEEPWVDDLKTGYHPPSVTGPQMLMYGLVAQRLSGSDTVRLSITHWRRGWEYPERKWQQVGPATLDAFHDELQVAYRRALRGDGPLGGSHCKYCPSAMLCPTVTGHEAAGD